MQAVRRASEGSADRRATRCGHSVTSWTVACWARMDGEEMTTTEEQWAVAEEE